MKTLAIVFLVCALGCEDSTPTTSPPYETVNSPVVVLTMNSFTYSINAEKFTGTSDQSLTFSSDSLLITVTSGKFSGGMAVVRLYDSLNTVIFVDTVASTKTTVLSGVKTAIPKRCVVELANLTSELSYVVVGN